MKTQQLVETHEVEKYSLMKWMQKIFTSFGHIFQLRLKVTHKMRHGSPHRLHAQVWVNPDCRPVVDDRYGAQSLQSLIHKHMSMSGTELYLLYMF